MASCNTRYVEDNELFKDLLGGHVNFWELALRQETRGNMSSLCPVCYLAKPRYRIIFLDLHGFIDIENARLTTSVDKWPQ